MTPSELPARELIAAIGIFLRHAYSGAVPENRRDFATLSDNATSETILSLRGVERLPATVDGGPGLAIRLGNSWYPHMKLTIRPYAMEPGYVFGVDTHDSFEIDLSPKEADAVRQLQTRNQDLARKIEAEWEQSGIPTQNGLLRRYLDQSRLVPAPSQG